MLIVVSVLIFHAFPEHMLSLCLESLAPVFKCFKTTLNVCHCSCSPVDRYEVCEKVEEKVMRRGKAITSEKIYM